MAWRPRIFAYDSFSRLTSSTNPESNTSGTGGISVPTKYSYDVNSNLVSKTVPTQNQQGTATSTLSYCYDALNRLTAKSYSASATCASPVATYAYDQPACLGQASCYNIGHRTSMTDAAGSESWSYDKMGRVLTDQRTTNGITKSVKYAYAPYLDGSIASITYPSGRVVNYSTGAAERILTASDSITTYATGIHYAPQGAMSAVVNGPGLSSTEIFNNRLQPCWMYTTSATALPTSKLCTDTATTGNFQDLKYNFSWGADDNGNVIGITNNRDTTRSQTFVYDQLNRLQSASSTSTHATNATNCWGEKYGIDAWGNLNSVTSLSSAYTGCTQEPTFSTTANARNRLPITGNTYDSAGNVITAPVGGITNSYSYNADNQMQSMTGLTTTTNYVYDGDGKRVQKTGSKLYWYGADGSVLDETDTTGSVTNATFSEYIFVGGRRMARRDSGGNVLYYFADHLGTSRTMAQVASGQTTATLCYDADFYPFGGERTVVNLCGQNYKFTGKERDQESGLDEFGARYYSGGFGRFMIPDWAAKPTDVPYANFGNPQSLNLYSYVQNNPTTLGDPDGHCSDDNKSDPCQPPPKSASQNAPPPPKKPFIPPAPFLKPNPTFKTAKQAGAAAARADQQRQKQTGFEHGSSAFKVANGVYTYTDPITQGDKYGVDPHNTTGVPDATTNFRDAPIPLGTQLTGEAHSHPGNDGFSGDDIQRGHDMRTPYYGHPEFEGAYVGLQNGSVIRYDVGTGHQTVFPPGEPQ